MTKCKCKCNRLPASWRCWPVLSFSEISLQTVFRNMENSDDKKEAASRQGVERGTIPQSQQREQQNRLNFKQPPCSIWPGRRKGDKLRPQPTPSTITDEQHLWNPQHGNTRND